MLGGAYGAPLASGKGGGAKLWGAGGAGGNYVMSDGVYGGALTPEIDGGAILRGAGGGVGKDVKSASA